MPLLEKEPEVVEATIVETTELVPPVDNTAKAVDTSLSFEDHVARFRSTIENNRKRTIKTVWEIGAFVCILKDNKTYGGKTVEAFAEAMGDESVSTKEIYKWAQFAERYNLDQVNRLLALNNIGWGVVCNLIRVKNIDTRTMLENKIDTGEVAPGKIQDVVSKLNKATVEAPGEEQSGKGAKNSTADAIPVNNCLSAFKKMNNLLENILTAKDSCAKDITDLSAILDDEAKYEKAVDKMDEYKTLLPMVIEALQDIEGRLNITI